MNQEYTTALVRGLIGAVISFGTVTLGAVQTGASWEDAAVAGGIAGLVYLAGRVGVEGSIDTQRKSSG